MNKPSTSANTGRSNLPGAGGFRPMGMHSKVVLKDTAATVRRLWSYLSQRKVALAAAVMFTVLSSAATLLAPYLLGLALDQNIVPKKLDGLATLCFILLAAYVGGTLAGWLQSYLMVDLAQKTVRDLRNNLFSVLQQQPMLYFDRAQDGDLMSRITNDVEMVSNTLNQSVTQAMSSVILLIGAVIFMFYLNVWLAIVSIITMPLILVATGYIAKNTRRDFASQQKKLGELNGFIEETLSGQKLVKLYRRENTAVARFKSINSELKDYSIKAQVVSGFAGPSINAIDNIAFIVMTVFGGVLVLHGMATLGVAIGFLGYVRQVQRPVHELANQFTQLQSALAAAERVFEVMDAEPEYADNGATISQPVHGEVAFHDVSFSYQSGHPILKNISFTARPNETIAIVGPTGSGKTTLINLLARFYEIDSGRITLDGHDIKDYSKNSLRRQLGIVLQDAYLFAGTLRENIRMGRLNATDEEIIKAAKMANADSFIRHLPLAYDTPIEAGGSNISQGQRQLITIARAFLADPEILVLDEATSNIDTRTEMHIQQAMHALMQGRTSFVIAHRLSTIREADQILVIKQGELIERGSHQQLLAMDGFYAELYRT